MSRLKQCFLPIKNPTKTRLRIQIPKSYQQEPVISRLTSDYGLAFNITAARLGVGNQENGLFDLELQGTPEQIQKALGYLVKLNVKVWGKPNPDGDSW